MGAADDSGPQSKRVKGSSFVLENFVIGSSLPGSIIPLGGPMARPLPTQGKEDLIGSKGVIKRAEFIRIITKTLYSLGYEKSGKTLEEESGVHLHSSAVILFRKQVLDRNWDESITTLQKIALDGQVRNSASFLILEYKFFDLLEKDRVTDALRTLRSEIAPLNFNKKRLHQLSSCIISSSQRGLIGWANLDIDNGKLQLKLLDELQKVIPPTVMIPEKRLETLIEQALSVQREACFFHNSLENALSLYTDHLCGKDQLPLKTLQMLQAHEDEIWFLQFSHDGKCLASSSNDGSVIIWEVHEDGEVSFKCTLKGHQKPVVMIAWSPDDRYLLSCGMEEVVRCWDVGQAECLRVFEKHGLGMLSCVWYPDGKKFFSGVTDRSISLWDLDGNEVENWKGHRTTKNSEMAVAKGGKQIIIMCKETTILILDWETKTAEPIPIEEDHTITSFSLSQDENFLLVNLSNEEIHLWSIAPTPTLVKKYQGHTRSRFVIRSCFGGFEQSFVASGSEDSQVYIWHKQTGRLVQPLAGHSGAVNCVSWNPANPYILASGSDDHTIRIWGLSRVNLKRKDYLSNGYANHCNGTAK